MRPAPPVAKLRPSPRAARAAAFALTAELDAQSRPRVSIVEDPASGIVKVYDGGKLYGACWSVSDEERA